MNLEPVPGIERPTDEMRDDGGDEDAFTEAPIIRRPRQPADDRDAFAAMLAHELRTPLTILKGRLHGLEDGIIDPSTGECGRLLDQVDRLLRIVDDVGLLTRLRAGDVFQDPKQADLGKMLHGAIDRASAMLLGKEAETVVRCEPATVWVDPILLTRLLDKIVVFAVSHMTRASHVAIDNLPGSEVCLAVRWTDVDPRSESSGGPGSEPVKSAGHRSLDLQIIAALAEAMGGTVSLAQNSQAVTKLSLAIPSQRS